MDAGNCSTALATGVCSDGLTRHCHAGFDLSKTANFCGSTVNGGSKVAPFAVGATIIAAVRSPGVVGQKNAAFPG